MKYKVDLAVGLFLIIGLLVIAYMSISFGDVDFFGRGRYDVEAVFTDVTGLKENTVVRLSGVKIGTVSRIELENYRARVLLRIDREIELPDPGTEASIRTEGLLGEQYISITPGYGRENIPQDGTGEIVETNPPLLIEDLLARFIFGEEDDLW